MKDLIYPFTFEQWLQHETTKLKLACIKQIYKEIKLGTQIEIDFD